MNPFSLQIENARAEYTRLNTISLALMKEMEYHNILDLIPLVEGVKYRGGKHNQKCQGYLTQFETILNTEGFGVTLHISEEKKPEAMAILREGTLDFHLKGMTANDYERLDTILVFEEWEGRGENITITISFYRPGKLGEQIGEHCYVAENKMDFSNVGVACKVE